MEATDTLHIRVRGGWDSFIRGKCSILKKWMVSEPVGRIQTGQWCYGGRYYNYRKKKGLLEKDRCKEKEP